MAPGAPGTLAGCSAGGFFMPGRRRDRVTDLVGAAASGDRVRALEALRDYLATALDRCTSGRDQAALARQLALVLSELEKCRNATDDAFAKITDGFEW